MMDQATINTLATVSTASLKEMRDNTRASKLRYIAQECNRELETRIVESLFHHLKKSKESRTLDFVKKSIEKDYTEFFEEEISSEKLLELQKRLKVMITG